MAKWLNDKQRKRLQDAKMYVLRDPMIPANRGRIRKLSKTETSQIHRGQALGGNTRVMEAL